MTLLGLDFDNTLVRYDKLFHQLALEKDLIEKSLPADKTTIRDYLRSQGKDEQFTLLQGEVYGLRILEAEPAEGMMEALGELHQRGIPMVLVSHKTRIPYKGPSYDLRQAALSWLHKYSFFEESFLNWTEGQVFFEETKSLKIERINSLQCTHYVDDLCEILEGLKKDIEGILYDPNRLESSQQKKKIRNWEELIQLVSKQ